jgi:NAD-dependent deacetylase
MSKKKLVVLTGAGISAESGLRTFRDSDGLWEGYNVYDVATPTAFAKNPQLVLDFYNMRRKDIAAAQPNEAHTGLAELEKDFDVTIITQNIDDLHERGGSSNVVHLHGEIFKMRSVTNSKLVYNIRGDINVGHLAEDGGQLASSYSLVSGAGSYDRRCNRDNGYSRNICRDWYFTVSLSRCRFSKLCSYVYT